jgi:hypothetical protein
VRTESNQRFDADPHALIVTRTTDSEETKGRTEMNTMTRRILVTSSGTVEGQAPMQTPSRRSVLRALAGGGLAGILALTGTHEADAAKNHRKKNGKKGRRQGGEAKKRKKQDSKNGQRKGDAAKDQQKQDANVAEIMAGALTIAGGSAGNGLSLNEEKLAGLNAEQVSTIKRLVSDINAGKLGIAVTDENGDVVALVGSEQALEGADGPGPDQLRDADGKAEEGEVSAQNSVWRDGWGLHYYIDSYWTNQLKAGFSSAVSAIASAFRYLLCYYGAACLLYGTVVNWVFYTLNPLLRRTRAVTTIAHAPWNGNVYVQVGPYWYLTSLRT